RAFSDRFGWELTGREVSEFDTMLGIAASVILLPIYFLATKLFYREPTPERARELEVYWNNLSRPVHKGEENADTDARQGKVLGLLSAFYGLFVVLLFLIPNEMGGRIVFIGCGSVLMLIGYLLYRSTHPRTPKLDVNP
ncbi:MAG: hypothetical protein RL648_1778, partial [Verrucomicrobiota bacterium]